MSEPNIAGNESSISVAPEFFVRDLERSLRFYVEKLGFQSVRQELDFAVVGLGDAHLLLAAPDEATPSSVDRRLRLFPFLFSRLEHFPFVALLSLQSGFSQENHETLYSLPLPEPFDRERHMEPSVLRSWCAALRINPAAFGFHLD